LIKSFYSLYNITMNNNKLYIKDYSGRKVAIQLQVQQYAKNWQIAILLYTPDGEYYSDLSVFIEEFKYQNFMCVDVNNLPNAEEFIEEYKLWTLIGQASSGFVTYPIYAMDIDELRKRDEKWVEELVNSKFWDEEKVNLRTRLS